MAALEPAFTALDDCESTLDELDRLCCVPGRSKSMQAIGRRLAAVRSGLGEVEDDASAADEVIERLERIGAQIGRLQIGCCAPNRLPLYADLLQGLTSIQLAVNEAVGRAH